MYADVLYDCAHAVVLYVDERYGRAAAWFTVLIVLAAFAAAIVALVWFFLG